MSGGRSGSDPLCFLITVLAFVIIIIVAGEGRQEREREREGKRERESPPVRQVLISIGVGSSSSAVRRVLTPPPEDRQLRAAAPEVQKWDAGQACRPL